MASVIKHPKKQTYLFIPTHRQNRHKEAGTVNTPHCPFCPGFEHETPPEVDRIGEGSPDSPGWQVRVVPNKYPITDIHEVIIHSPSHTQDLSESPPDQFKQILTMYQRRLNVHKDHGTPILFCNSGKQAGASLPHAHSQLAILPPEISISQQTIEPVEHIIAQTQFHVAYCPEYSEWPLEVWIKPSSEQSFITMNTEALMDLSTLLPAVLKKIREVAHSSEGAHQEKEVPYNIMLINPSNWALRITPRLQIIAGFELATGTSVNTIPAEKASSLLKL